MPKGSRVLMADDDKMLIDMYQERLELAGYIVTTCRNGEEALGKVRETKPDIILLDIMMPKINGYEALASIKSDPATKDIPVIMLSALMRDFNREKAVEAGADDYLIKSEAMPADVITKIEQVLTKYGKGSTPAPGPGQTSSPSALPSNIPAPSATPPQAPPPSTPAVPPTPPVAPPVNTPVATPDPSVIQPDQNVFTPAPTTNPNEPAPQEAEKKIEPETHEVPVVKLDKPLEAHKTPTMAWEPEPGQALRGEKNKKPASVALIVILSILLTALVNDIVIYFFFFINR